MIKVLVMIFMFLPVFCIGMDLKQVREEYYEAVKNEKAAEKLVEKLSQNKSQDPIFTAYLGASQAVKAKHAINPYNKITFLKSGLKTLNSAVVKSPENLEIRFLRFSLEHYLPGFLGFSKNLVADRKKMVELIRNRQLGAIDQPLLKNIISFMKESKRCTPDELAILNKAI